MNFEDYYKTLELRPNVGQVKIAIQYLKLVNRNYALIPKNEQYREDFYRVNRAIEVLKNEAIRKYYDIIYNEISNKTLNINNIAVKKYLKIVNGGIIAGNKKADSLLADSEYRTQSGIIQTPKAFWLKFLVYMNPNLLFKYIHLPILSLICLIIGLTIILKQIENYNSEYLIIGILISLFSISVLNLNFVKYIIDKVNK